MHEDHPRVMYAQHAHEGAKSADNDKPDVILNDAHVYDFLQEGHPDDTAMTVEEIAVPTGNRSVKLPEYAATAASTVALAASHAPEDVAELQWRLSTPISLLLLGLLGVPLSRAKPRQSKYAKMGTAILIYSAYYLLCSSARTWVQHGTIHAFPGIWWAPAVLFLILVIATAWPAIAQPLPRAKFKLRLPRRPDTDLPAFLTELDARQT
jgi:lipopolysaccharide export system permease protein